MQSSKNKILVNIPYSGGCLGKNRGCELAFKEIKKVIPLVFSSESNKKVCFTESALKIKKGINQVDMNRLIFNKAKKIFGRKTHLPIFIGGDHSITFPIFQAFLKNFKNSGLVILDAHPDVCSNRFPPSHEDYLRSLIEQKYVTAHKVILIGLRNPEPKEIDFLKDHNISLFTAQKIFINNIQNVTRNIIKIIKNWKTPFYLSIDIDVTDPAFAPGTGYPEPAGFTSREVIFLIQELSALDNLKGGDLVEINPLKDIQEQTVKLGARILAEIG